MADVLDHTAARRSSVVYVVIRLVVRGEDYFVLQAHEKWGDWSLVGGHVEKDELGDWSNAAVREAEEELAPLHWGIDFVLERIPNAPARWGPVTSKSAGGAATEYRAEWFALRFLSPPSDCLRRLPADDFLLALRRVAVARPEAVNVAPLLQKLEATLKGGLDDVPLAWPESLDAAVPLRVVRDLPSGDAVTAHRL